jgi:type I restriction enzyme S subunit
MQKTLFDEMESGTQNGHGDGESSPKQGFKKTKVGWIPEDWTLVPLSECGSWHSGGTPSRSNPAYWGGDIPWVSAKSFSFHIDSAEEYVTEEGAEAGSRLVPKNTVLMLVRGMGLAKSFPVGLTLRPATFNQDVKAIRPGPDVDPHFLAYALKGQEARVKHLADRTSHGTLRLQTKTLKDLRIPLPEYQEQRVIAEILATWDHALTQIDDLIAAKERRKKALMQQLLTGKTRLPEFEDEDWVDVEIGELLKRVRRYVDWDDSAQYDLVSVRRGSEGLYHRESIYGHEKKTKKLHKLKEGDFVISRMQVVHGATAYVTSEFEGMHVSNSYIILVARDENGIDTEYFSWLAKLPYMYHLAYLASHGVHIEKMTFKPKFYFKNKVRIPSSVEEQRRILSILKACEDEIQTLRAERDALQRQKKGMMQKLLTGTVRVPAARSSTQAAA